MASEDAPLLSIISPWSTWPNGWRPWHHLNDYNAQLSQWLSGVRALGLSQMCFFLLLISLRVVAILSLHLSSSSSVISKRRCVCKQMGELRKYVYIRSGLDRTPVSNMAPMFTLTAWWNGRSVYGVRCRLRDIFLLLPYPGSSFAVGIVHAATCTTLQ